MKSFTFSFNDESEKQALWGSKKSISFEDYLELTACVFNWADSYDAKVTSPPFKPKTILTDLSPGLGSPQEHSCSHSPL